MITFNILGNSLTSLVLVSKLVNLHENININWFKKLSLKNQYGHFSGNKVFNNNLDFGMLALEVDIHETQKKNFEKFEYPKGIKINPYLIKVRDWFDEMDLKLNNFKVYSKYKDKIFDDFFISNSLDILNELKNEKIKFTNTENHLHPKNKYLENFPKFISIHDYFTKVYGDSEYTTVINNFLDKIKIDLKYKLITSKHRSLWIPLYYPETLILENHTFFPAQRIFSVPSQDTFANFLDNCFLKLIDNSNLNIIDIENLSFKDEILELSKIKSNNIFNIFCGDEHELNTQKYIHKESVEINFVYLKTRTDLTDNIYFDADKNNYYFRVTTRNLKSKYGFNYICVETAIGADNEININQVHNYVNKLLSNKISLDGFFISKGYLNILSKDFVNEILAQSENVNNFLNKYSFINLSNNNLNNSMNEQILKALWYYEVHVKK